MLRLIIIFSLLLAMASCSSVRKSQTYHTATTDSTHLKKVDSSKTVTVDSGQLHQVDSTRVIREKGKTTTDITIYFDSVATDSPNPPEDYLPADTLPKKKKTGSIKITVDKTGTVDVDLGNNKPTRIEISKTGDYQKTDSSSTQISDSSHYHGTDSSSYQVTDSSNKKKRLRTAAPLKRKSGSRSWFPSHWSL